MTTSRPTEGLHHINESIALNKVTNGGILEVKEI